MALDQETLADLFGEPVESPGNGEPWAHSFSVYRASAGSIDIEFQILPASGEFLLKTSMKGDELLRIRSDHQTNLAAYIERGQGFLVFGRDGLHTTTIRVKPDFYFGQDFNLFA
ncbi:MAG: hypothetical protein AAFQ22_15315 [Pseudomonadota bacterium]